MSEGPVSDGHGVEGAPNIPSRDAAVRRPRSGHLARIAAADGLAGKIVPADAVDQAHIVQWQHIGPQQVEDQEHLGGPAANATDRDQFANDGLVVHPLPGSDMHSAGVEMQGQVNQVLDLARAQPRRPHVVHLELEHVGRRHGPRQARKPVPHRLCRLDRDLLAHDASRQSREGVTARLQTGITKLRDQPLHDPVLADQVLAGLVPVRRCGDLGNSNLCSRHRQSNAGESLISL